MTKYTKTIDGKVVIKEYNHIVINKDGMQIFNPTNEMLLEDGWMEYIIPELTEEQLFNIAKQNKLDDIIKYDSSEEVNIFYIQDIPVWLDKATRAGLKLRFEAELENAKTETILWHEGSQFLLNLDNAMKMLYGIELYASKCYDNTQSHIVNVSKLSTTEEIELYDYKTGYPEKLYF